MTKKDIIKLRDELTKAIKERDNLLSEYKTKMTNIQQRINRIQEEIFESMDTMIKIKCPRCRGVGHTKDKDKRTVCNICGGRGYLWEEKYTKTEK